MVLNTCYTWIPAKAPGQVELSSLQKDQGCDSVFCLCSALQWQSAKNYPFNCYSSLEPRNVSPCGSQSQLIKGCSPRQPQKTKAPEITTGGTDNDWGHCTCVRAPLQDILAVWSVRGESREAVPALCSLRKGFQSALGVSLVRSFATAPHTPSACCQWW